MLGCVRECVRFLVNIHTYRVHEKHAGGCGQVKPHPSSFERQEHDGGAVGLRALELMDDLGSPLLAHGAVQAHKSETLLPGGEVEGEFQDF